MRWEVIRLARCSKCRKDLPLDFFHRDWTRPPTYRQRICKRCRRKRVDSQRLTR